MEGKSVFDIASLPKNHLNVLASSICRCNRCSEGGGVPKTCLHVLFVSSGHIISSSLASGISSGKLLRIFWALVILYIGAFSISRLHLDIRRRFELPFSFRRIQEASSIRCSAVASKCCGAPAVHSAASNSFFKKRCLKQPDLNATSLRVGSHRNRQKKAVSEAQMIARNFKSLPLSEKV